jgi:hypothetical protein
MPTAFALPTVQNAAFQQLTGGNSCPTAGAVVRWSLLRLDDDTAPDLVLSAACNDTTVGTSHWQVYPATCGQ